MKVLIKTVAAFAVITLGAGLGAQMHEQVQMHDASLRYRSEPAEQHVKKVFEFCAKTDNPDLCALIGGITI